MDGFQAVIPYALSSFLISFFAVAIIIQISKSTNLNAKSDKRRLQKNPIPLFGGFGVIIGATISLTFFQINHPQQLSTDLMFLVPALFMSLVIGGLDDYLEIRARWKFLSQNIITGLIILSLHNIATPADRLFGLNTFASFSLEWFWCLGMLNSINLIDGLDGLASGIAMIAICLISILNDGLQQPSLNFMYLVTPAILGFYLWNKYPAKIYIGESGVLAIGIFLSVASLSYDSEKTTGVTLVVPLFALGVPILDTLLAIGRRLYRGTGLMSADREHLHHRMMRIGLSHPAAVSFIHIISLYLGFIGYQIHSEGELKFTAMFIILSGLGINLFLLMSAEGKLFNFLRSFASQMLRTIDENRTEVESARMRIRTIQTANIPHVLLRINLNLTIKSMLERSPGKIKIFYQTISNYICGESSQREIHFENSTTAVVLISLEEEQSSELVINQLKKELEGFEKKEKLDLYLYLPNSITVVSEYRYKDGRAQYAA
ncbi:MAG: undecaprenyl/decaprenyl-phosphate alpha-N-acetylglucosaminyl 1-phosphate transferase [Oligoflexia bacterium]|nr:undecaprenyl/decaprenyl-phosphate alpha-N-acetylglucosaminyl 1-phosphate transferase [Oligoflexia bacterium]